ncbi:hypothetical protein ABZ319_08155 [Nocardia sp. NPDC005978]|uniref:hypothetical protein n=1 Tax=Nocardia sp. NPDC005978 TaxID=3156725 RepID=UPI0033BB5C1C
MTTLGDAEPTTADEADRAIALVRANAPDARFGRFTAAPVPNRRDTWQVTRVDADGLILRDGWTFLVNLRTAAVTRKSWKSLNPE